jgi:hypothetical protein
VSEPELEPEPEKEVRAEAVVREGFEKDDRLSLEHVLDSRRPH